MVIKPGQPSKPFTGPAKPGSGTHVLETARSVLESVTEPSFNLN
jgi:hypothetical protein